MSVKEITGLLTILPDKENAKSSNVEELQAGNIAFRNRTLVRTLYYWDNNTPGSGYNMYAYPFKNGGLLDDTDLNTPHGIYERAVLAYYPFNITGSAASLSTLDFSKFRATGSAGTAGSALIPRVHAGLVAFDTLAGISNYTFGGDCIVSASDLPADYTQIGIVYAHPMYQVSTAGTGANYQLVTVAGQNYVTFTSDQWWDNAYITPSRWQVLRIASGADAGFYYIQHRDDTNNRLYLRNLDGSSFVAQASATLASTELYMGPGRTTYFNEVSVIPFSTGTVVTGGRFVPGFYPGTTQPLRSSFICKVKIEKTGSTEVAAAAEQQGSYTIGMRPWTHGDYDQGTGWEWAFYRASINEGGSGQFLNHAFPYSNTIPASANAMILDEVNQRCWVGVSNSDNNSCLLHWRWRTLEGPREVACSSAVGTAASSTMLTPMPVLASGDVIRGGALGSNQWVYFAVQHPSLGNGGLIIIKPDLTTLQYNETNGFPESNCAAVVVDKTRARTFSDVSTTAASDVIDDNVTSTFTSADVGRVIKINTGADAGNYKIATITDTNTVTVTTLAGAAVSFTGSSNVTAEVGDRAYLFFNNNTTGAGQINYMESLAPGTFFTRTVSMTNGTNCNVQSLAHNGESQKAFVDPANGNVYWLSNDTLQQINKYDPTANTHSFIAATNTALLSPPGHVLRGGTSTTSINPATPTVFTSILVNSKFDEIWVGSDVGLFKIPKSTFAVASTRRYLGTENSSWVSGPVVATGTGNGTTGLSFSTPNMTLNATGTPFTASMVGKYVMILGATTAANNGVFPITAFNSTSSITFTNASGATQANYAGTFYIVSSWAIRSAGSFVTSAANTSFVRNIWEQPDGRVCITLWAGATGYHDYAFYSREADTPVYRRSELGSNGSAVGRNRVYDSIGWWWDMAYGAWSAGARMHLGSVEVNYQWTGSAWTPLEVALAGTPNKSFADTTNPLCAAKPIHSTLDNVMYGVKIQFNRQGGATPNNNEFLGRMGQTRTTASDGATVTGAATFDGSGFVAGDAGRTIRIETGADAGIYKINTYVNAGQVTLKTMDGRTFSALATAGTLTYTVWDYGAVGSTAGPEEMTFILADGVSKDNTQDITGFNYEAYHFKTRLHENDEPRKFCVENPLATPGALATKAYFESYPRGTPQYNAALSHHLALPAAEWSNGRNVLDGVTQKYLNNTANAGDMYSSFGNTGIWYGTAANSEILGYSLMVDFGVDVEVGYAILRVRSNDTDSRLISTATNNGIRAAVYKAVSAGGAPLGSLTASGTGNGTTGLTFSSPTMTLNSTGTPFSGGDVGKYIVITGAAVAANNGSFLITAFNSSSSISYTNASGATQNNYAGTWYLTPTANVRTTGTANFNCTANVVNTSALSSGDFLGPTTLTPSTPAVGAIVSGANTLTDTTNAPFLTTHVGQVLKITAGAGADIGAYRVIGYTSSSVITVRNLDQTAKAWSVSSSTVTYVISDGVREEDQIVVANGAHRLCVERLLTSTTLQLRTAPNATITNQSWICVRPTWDLVKKVSHNVDAVPPDVKNNGTWASHDGRETYSFNDVKFYTDFSDLSSSARTGRFWKWTGIPRFDTNAADTTHNLSTWEFYDVAGNRLATSKYTLVDEARTNADFFFTHINRVDFIQAANDAMSGIAGFNGNVNLGGGNGDTLTLTTGGNKFLGFQIGPTLTDGNLPIGTNIINSAASSWPASAMPGRFIRITSGAHSGEFYRVATRPSTTQVTVTTPSGTAVSWGATESSITFTVHEGINVGGAYPDKFVFTDDGREYTLLTINDTLTTLTIAETLSPARTNKAWEIRRPGYDTSSATTEATKTARLTRPQVTYPVQSGDLLHDARGTYRFFADDIGTGFQRADGVIAGGNGNITGSEFSPDDVGRLLYIASGVNTGIWEIDQYTSSTAIRVKNHYTGAAATLTADAGPVTYQIFGDRRFRLTRFVVGLRA